MKSKRRLLSLLAIGAAAALALSACSSTGSSTASSSTTKHYKLVFIPGVAGDPFYITMGCAAEAEAKKLGATLTTQGPTQFEASLQIPIVNSVVASNPDAILVAPTDVNALYAPLKAATSGGKKVVLVDTTLANPSLAVSRVSSNNVAGGAAAFKAIEELHPNGGAILAIAVAPGVSTNDERLQGFEAAAKKDPKFKFLGVQYDQDQTSTATQVMTSALSKDPNIVGVFATSTFSVDGASTGLRQAGKQGSVSLVGFDAEPSQLAELKAGTVQALVAQRPAEIGIDGVKQAIDALNGKKTTKVIQTGEAIITQKNLATVGAKYAYESKCS